MIVRELLFRLGLKVNPREFHKAEQGVENIRRNATGAASGIQGLAGSIGGMLAAIGGTAALFAGGRWLVGTIASMESLKTSLIGVTGSAEAAEAAFARIKEFAARTPFSVEEVATAFRKLSALGLDPSERALESYGNTASVMGKNLDQMVEAVADATVGEFERLKEFGIKAKSEGNKVTFTFRGVKTTVKKDAKEIQQYLLSLGETGAAVGAMERQSKTLGGLWSTLKDQAAAFAIEVGDAGLLGALHEFMAVLFESAGGAGVVAKALGFVLGNALRFLTVILKAVVSIVRSAVDLFKRMIPRELVERTDDLGRQLERVLKVVLLTIAPVAFLLLLLEDFIGFMQGRKSVIGDFVEALKDAPGIVGDLARALDTIRDPAYWETVKRRAGELFATIQSGTKTASSILDRLRRAWDFVRRVFDTFARAFDLWWRAAEPVFDFYGDLLGDIADRWAEVGEKTTELAGPIGELLAALHELAALAFDVWEAFINTEAVGAFADFAGARFAQLGETLRTIASVVGDVFQALYNAWVDQVGSMITMAATIIDGLVKGIRSLPTALEVAWFEFFQWLEGAINGAVEAINGMIREVESVSGIVGVELGRIGKVSLTTPITPAVAPGGRGGGSTTVQNTVGSVTVEIDGSTGMGESEVRRAVREGVVIGNQETWGAVERMFGVGAR